MRIAMNLENMSSDRPETGTPPALNSNAGRPASRLPLGVFRIQHPASSPQSAIGSDFFGKFKFRFLLVPFSSFWFPLPIWDDLPGTRKPIFPLGVFHVPHPRRAPKAGAKKCQIVQWGTPGPSNNDDFPKRSELMSFRADTNTQTVALHEMLAFTENRNKSWQLL